MQARSTWRSRPDSGQHGFTIVELVVVIALLGLLAAVALPRFVNLTEDAHTAHAQGMKGAFGAAVALAHGSWVAGGSVAATVDLEGTAVPVSASGYPAEAGAPPMTQAGCAALWTDLLASPPPVAVGYNPNTDGWGALAGGALCVWVYETDVTPLRIILYDTSTGAVSLLIV